MDSPNCKLVLWSHRASKKFNSCSFRNQSSLNGLKWIYEVIFISSDGILPIFWHGELFSIHITEVIRYVLFHFPCIGKHLEATEPHLCWFHWCERGKVLLGCSSASCPPAPPRLPRCCATPPPRLPRPPHRVNVYFFCCKGVQSVLYFKFCQSRLMKIRYWCAMSILQIGQMIRYLTR